jgi:rhamnogalacturonan endolyase
MRANTPTMPRLLGWVARTVLACAVAAAQALANVPGGGTGQGADVALRDEGDSFVLDNGVVAIRINKADASIGSFGYQGINLFAGGHNGGRFYWSWNAPAYGGPHGTASLVVDPATTHGDYAEVKIHSPWSGKPGEAAMDVDVYYTLTRGAQGFYAATTLAHPAAYPALDVGEFRSNAYVSPMFDWLSVDDQRQRLMPTTADMAASVRVPGAPKEVTALTTGRYAGQFECKYAYSADLGDLNVWGWTSTTGHMGIWMTVPSHEYYNGGPMKRELTVHMDHTLLNMLNGSHYNMGNQLKVAAGRGFEKTYGPYFIYANSGRADAAPEQLAQTLWQDAKAQASAEQGAWPYAWFHQAGYVAEAGRGAVRGVLRVRDSAATGAATGAAAGGAWVGLAPDDDGTDFQQQARSYQFWVRADKDGRFAIPHVLPGTYHLWAFGAGQIGTFHRADVTVRAGGTLDLGAVEWAPPRVAPTLWEIGIPDRDTHEFANGDFAYTQWATYARLAQQKEQTFTIGRSDWRKDWNYAQFGDAPWTVRFALAGAPAKDATASLYIALASSEATVQVSVNGTPVGSFAAPQPSHAPIRLGSHGAFAETRMTIPASLLRPGQNSVTFTQQVGRGRAVTTQYDYIRMEAQGMTLAPPKP